MGGPRGGGDWHVVCKCCFLLMLSQNRLTEDVLVVVEMGLRWRDNMQTMSYCTDSE